MPESLRFDTLKGLLTFNKAEFVIARPKEFIETTRYSVLTVVFVVATVKLVAVAPETSFHVDPPSVLFCH